MAITIIGILTGLSMLGLNKAQQRSKVMKTQSTITKLHQQIMTKWESYKFRRAPVDAKLLLTGSGTQQGNALAFINQLWVNRGGSATDPLGAGFAGSSLPTSSFPTTAQLSAAKLLVMRELQRYEMPTGWSDIIQTDAAGVFQGSAGNWTMRTPQVLVTVPQLAWAYLQRVNRAVDASGQPLTQAQIEQYDAAECLYQIVKLACEDESNAIADNVKEVGDADGDGLPEFQDAFTGMDRNYVTNAPANNPIMWNRWPSGFTNLNLADASGNFKESFHVSDYQDDPANLVEEQTGGAGQNLQVVTGAPAMLTFSADNHDYFDPLKLDMPVSSGGANYPRGQQLTPLIYSAGLDATYGLVPTAWNGSSNVAQNAPSAAAINDPYAVDMGPLPVSPPPPRRNAQWYDPTTKLPLPGTLDNITNHIINAR